MREADKKMVKGLRKAAYDADLYSAADSETLLDVLADARDRMYAAADALEGLAQERDALEKDMTHAGMFFMHCETCKKGKLNIDCEMWEDEKGRKVCDYIWRGPCAENGGVTNV